MAAPIAALIATGPCWRRFRASVIVTKSAVARAAGDAKLRRRWPMYFLGMYVFAFFPVRIELRLLGGREPWLVAAAIGAAIICHFIGRARARRWSVEPPEELLQDGGTISVLNI